MTRLSTIGSLLALTLAACAPSVGDVGDDTGSGGGGGAGGGGNGTVGPDANCPSVNFMATQVTPSIHLVIDRSGSMATLLPNTNTSRYQAMRDALVGTNGVVGQLQSKAYFAASLYSSDNPCPRMYNTASRAKDNFTQVKSLIDSQSPNGNTPTPAAIDSAVAAFAANPAPTGSPPIIVLATDGLPNSCNSDADTQAESVASTKNAYTAGIRTFVLGIAGVNDGFLQSMANAGQGVAAGQPNAKYYTANSPADLQTAFQQIIGGIVSCELNITGQVDPAQAQFGTVTLNGSPLTYGTEWTVSGSTIKLLGAACDKLKTSSNPQVQASFPCGSVIL